jgi:hypothetical protein
MRTIPTRTAVGVATLALLLSALTACGGSEPTDPTVDLAPSAAAAGGEPASEGASTPVTAGQATIEFGDSREAFELVNCASGTSTSVQGSGTNDSYTLTIDVQDGTGGLGLADNADMVVALDASVDQVEVAADGSFTLSGTYTSDGTQGAFTATGTCGMVNWS